jgi:hypothetical protein
MKLDRMTACQTFEVWNPRWHDRVALLADYKLGTHNLVRFPKAGSLPGDWYISLKKAKSFPTEYLTTKAGGKMLVRAIPLDEFEPLEREK